MTVSDVIVAVCVGVMIGAVGPLVVPADRQIPWWLPMSVGVSAALLGTIVAQTAHSSGVTPREFIAQLVFAALGITVVAATADRRSPSRR